MKRFILLVLLVLALGLLAACAGSEPAPQPAATQVPCPECAVCPEAASCPEPVACPEAQACPEPVVANVPFEQQWANSPHNDSTSESFTHWDSEDPAVIPADCAKCHSETGYLDFLGADGSEPGVINAESFATGTTVTCAACHNDMTASKTSVVFPSGVEIAHLGAEARCMECHQGRESKVSVDASIEKVGLTENVDEVSADLGFTNIHYFAAAATQFGAEAMGGYQYDGKAYDVKFEHVQGFDTCDTCHDSHTLELKLDQCQTCHTDVKAAEDFQQVRLQGSESDYDGDGDVEEGVFEEVAGLQEILIDTMQVYATEFAGASIAHSSSAYPYFFVDTNADGVAGEDEAIYPNAFKSWTPRLLKAAYNYQVASKDPGDFAHNGKYIIQLLYDSIDDLSTVISPTVPVADLARNDPGHFAGSEEAFRHWDADGVVPADCVKCHQAQGLPQRIAEGVNTSMAPSNGLLCSTCHTDYDEYARHEIAEVQFPSGAKVTMADTDSNLCISCHQGRASAVTVDNAVKGLEEDTVPERALRFSNIHYFAAGATLFGNEVQGAYQFAGLDYLGQFTHVPGFENCTSCHATHELSVQTDKCFTCHAGVETMQEIRGPLSTADYDGDGDTAEGIDGEIQTMSDAVYAAMQDYATTVIGKGILYDSHAYPYFFEDTNGDGVRNEEEPGFSSWTPRLLKAAYNYQYVQKDPGAFVHNGKYVIQFLYDTLSSLGQRVTVDMAGMVRPDTPAAAE
jgi:nitrate/TMAO reductase-like tetraheme cytochrome c subunit